ncbi:hypothetical protein [Sphingosinicella xenopeptidilytica]|uniref:Uncharacterized protein n=1 Tax=Sphingosinicella xenopeptidilytica TaxID=364098 RepID=A0ABW3C3Y2_SPHXN
MTYPTFYGVTASLGGINALSLNVSSVTAAGRQLWIGFRSANQPIAAPSGWTDVTNSSWGDGTAGGADANRLQLFKKNDLADGSETTVTLADSGSSNFAFAFATSPADIDVQNVSTGAYTTSPSWPGVTTTGADSLIALFSCADYDVDGGQAMSGVTNANLSSITERFDDRTNQGNGGGITLTTGLKATAGAIGTTTGTLAASASAAGLVLGVVALKEPGGGGPTQETTPTDLEITSIVPGPDSCDVTFDCASGGGSPTGLEYGVVTSSGDTPGAWTAIAFGDLPYTFSAAGSRTRYLKVRATGSLDPSPPATVEFATPALVQENGDSASGITEGEFGAATVTVAADAPLGDAGIIEARWTGTAGNTVGEDVTVNVIDAEEPPEPGVWTIKIDGVEKTPEFLGNHVTPSGTWPCYYLGDLPDGARAYMDLYNSNVDFCRVRIHRLSGYTTGAHMPTTAPIIQKHYDVSINGDVTSVGVLNGAIGHCETVQPVAFTSAALVAAMNAKRIMPCSVSAFSGWPRTPSTTPGTPPGNAPKTYVPARIYGRASTNNTIGFIEGAGGEYTSSRGFLPGEEAQILSAAFDNNTTMFNAMKDWIKAQTYYSPTVPHLCIWSANHHTLRDPQKPFSGDATYFNQGSSAEDLGEEGYWRVPFGYPYAVELGAFYTSIVSVTNANPCVVTYDGPVAPVNGQGIYIRDATGMTELSGSFTVTSRNTTAKTFVLQSGGVNVDSTGWGTYTGGATGHSTLDHGRDEAHLFNHGFTWWVATGDPLAAILMQGIAAYALASVYQGKNADGTYRHRFDAQRATANFWPALWRLRDVAIHASGPNLWTSERALQMCSECLDDWSNRIDAIDAGTDATSIMLRLIGSLDGDNGFGISNFQTQMYSTEGAYLWASAGRPKMLERIARQMVTRFLHFGGTRGVYGTRSGSALGLREVSGGPITYSDLAGMIDYVNTNSTWINTSFAGAAQHTVHRAYWLLKMAQDAVARGWISPVDDLDEAVDAILAARAVAPPDKDLGVVSWKHSQIDFGSAGIA